MQEGRKKRNLRLLKKSCFLRNEKTSQAVQYFVCIFLLPLYTYMYECNFLVSLLAGTYCTYSDVVSFYVAWSMMFLHGYSIAYYLIFLHGLITCFFTWLQIFLLTFWLWGQLIHVKVKWISVSGNTLLPIFLIQSSA